MADHVDIGVAPYRSAARSGMHNWLVESLGETPRVMHVEAITDPLPGAMRMGGGIEISDRWYCWANTQWKRVLKESRANALPGR